MNVDGFAQQLKTMQWRLDELYQNAEATVQVKPDLLPLAFKELGIVSEELQVAVEELQQQNAALADARQVIETERQRYQELFQFAPNGYLVTDEAGTIQEANHAAAKLLNVSQQFLVGKPLLVFVAEAERQSFHTQLLQLQTLEEVKEWGISLCPRDGKPFKASLMGKIMRGWTGKAVGLRLCICDISSAGRDLCLYNPADLKLERNDSDPYEGCPKHVYLKGEMISLKPQTIWVVSRGIVKLSTISETGEEVLVGLAGPSMPFGSNLTTLETYQATALSEVELASFSLTDIATYPNLAQKVLPQINQRLRQTEALLAISGQRHVKDRLHNLLLLLKKEIGQPVEQGTRLSVRFTHQDLASACSTTRVTITRMLGKLQAQGKIILDSQNHIILKEQDI
jgi:PAS domain S-box-containing protein